MPILYQSSYAVQYLHSVVLHDVRGTFLVASLSAEDPNVSDRVYGVEKRAVPVNDQGANVDSYLRSSSYGF